MGVSPEADPAYQTTEQTPHTAVNMLTKYGITS